MSVCTDLTLDAEADLYEQLRSWVDLFVAFAKTASPAEVLESVHSNAAFWQTFLGISAIIGDEKYAYILCCLLPFSRKCQLTRNA